MKKGDIVLVSFPFTDMTERKLRPAVVLFETESDFTACFITSQIERKEATENRLKIYSLIRVAKIATFDKQIAKGLLGNLKQSLLIELNTQLRYLLKL